MAADDADLDPDATGADVGVGQFNLNPGFGLDPSRPVRLVPTAAQAVATDLSGSLLSPVSVTQTPAGSALQPIAPAPGQPVNLLPKTTNLVPTPTVAPVVPAGSLAPQVQVAQNTLDPSATVIPQSQGGPGGVAPVARQPLLPGAPSPGHGRGLFGSNSPDYPAYDPTANPLVTRKGILQAEMDFLQGQINRPSLKFFQAGSVEKMAAEAAQKAGEIAQIDQQLQEQKNNQLKADNSNLPRNQQTATQNNDTIVENLVQRYRAGDQNAGDALKARGLAAMTTAYQTDHVTALESKLDAGTKIKNLLDTAVTDADYDRLRKELEDGTHPLSHPDFNVPKTLGEWQAQRAIRDKNAREAKLTIERYHQTVASQTAFTNQPDKAKGEIQVGNLKMSNGEVMPGTTPKIHLGNGAEGVEDVNGSHDMRKFGADKGVEGTWGNYGTAQGETIGKEMELAFPKSEREKAISFNRIYEGATHDKNGKLLPAGQVNTNPNMQQGIAEGLASILRGGAGGANSQLMKLELAKRGIAQNTIDNLVANFSGIRGALTGKEGQYLSKLSQSQVREVMDFIKKYNDADVSGRLQGVAEHIGRYGGRLDQSPIEEELRDNPGLKAAQARGRDAEKLHRSQIPAIVTDHSRIYLDNGPAGMAVPGAVRQRLPPSMLPGLYPELQTPQVSTTPPPAIPLPASVATAPQTGAAGPAAPSPGAVVAPAPAAAAGATRTVTVPLPYNPRAGQYGGTRQLTVPAAPAPAAAPPAAIPAGASPFTGGATPIPYTPGAPATTAPGPRSEAGPLTRVGNAIIPAAHAEGAPPVPATLPASWGAGVGGAPAMPAARPAAPVQPSVPTPQQPGGPGTGATTPPPAVAAPTATRPSNTYTNGVPSGGFPAHIAGNPVARQVFGVAGQTAQNVTQGNPNSAAITNNASIIATSSAQSESSFNSNETHDGGRGYGLFGHNGDRLAAMHQFAGTKPGDPIPVNAQTSFYVREMSKAADSDPFIARVLGNPNASAEDLTRVQIRMEKPAGYKGPGTEEQASNWSGRLANTRALMGGAGGAGGPNVAAAPAAQPATLPYPNPKNRDEALANYRAGQRQTSEEAAQYQQLRQQRLDQATQSAAHLAPALGGAAGGVIGSAGGPVGTVLGGAIGGGAGGAVENYFTGGQEKQNPAGYLEAGGWGAAKGAATNVGGAGWLGSAARVAGSTAVPAVKAWYEGGDATEMYDAGMKGLAEGTFGEAFGRGLGIGHQVWNKLSTPGKSELLAAGKILATQEAKIMGPGGKMVDNPQWQQAEAAVKKLHQDPDTVAYNYNETVAAEAAGKIPKTMGEALTQRPGAVAEAKIGREQYNPIKEEVGGAGAAANAAKNVPPGTQFKPQIAHDPVNIVGKHPDVPNTPEYRQAAATARDQMNAKAGSWREIWDNQITARSNLLQKSREAENAAPYVGQQQDVKAYRAMADEVRAQQEHIAKTLLPPAQSQKIMKGLTVADEAYREAKVAGGKDIVKTIAGGGEKGRDALAAFNKLAGNDPAAKGMLEALVKLHNKTEGRVTSGAVFTGAAALAHFIPGIGTMAGAGISAVRGLQLLQQHMLQKAAGKTATFDQLIQRQLSDKARARYQRAGTSLAGPVASQGLNMLQSDEASP